MSIDNSFYKNAFTFQFSKNENFSEEERTQLEGHVFAPVSLPIKCSVHYSMFIYRYFYPVFYNAFTLLCVGFYPNAKTTQVILIIFNFDFYQNLVSLGSCSGIIQTYSHNLILFFDFSVHTTKYVGVLHDEMVHLATLLLTTNH